MPAYRIRITAVDGRYRIETECLTDAWRDVVLQRVRFVRLQATLAASRLDVILAPTWPTGAAAVLGVSLTPAASSGVRCVRPRRILGADCRRYGRAIVADLRVVVRVCRHATAWCLFSATLADTIIVARILRYAFLAPYSGRL